MRLGIRMILVLLIVLALQVSGSPTAGAAHALALALVVAWVLNPLVKENLQAVGPVERALLLLILLACRSRWDHSLGWAIVWSARSVPSLTTGRGIWESFRAGFLPLGKRLDKFWPISPDEVETFVNESLDGLNAWLSVWVNDAMVGMGTRAKDFAFSLPSFVGGADCLHHGHPISSRRTILISVFGHGQDARRVRDFFSRVKHTALGAFAGYVRAEGHHLHRRVCHFAGRVPADPSALFRTAGRAAGRSGLYPHHRLGDGHGPVGGHR